MIWPFTRKPPEERFWRWFQAHSDRILRFEHEPGALDTLAAALRRVDRNLSFELGSLRDGRRELAISAGGIATSFDAVRRLVAAAPELPGWHLIAFRQPKSLDLVIEIGDLRLGADDVWFEAFRERRDDDTGERIALALHLRGYDTSRRELYGQAAFILLDMALGEVAVATRVGGIDLGPLEESPEAAGLTPFRAVRELFAEPPR